MSIEEFRGVLSGRVVDHVCSAEGCKAQIGLGQTYCAAHDPHVIAYDGPERRLWCVVTRGHDERGFNGMSLGVHFVPAADRTEACELALAEARRDPDARTRPVIHVIQAEELEGMERTVDGQVYNIGFRCDRLTQYTDDV